MALGYVIAALLEVAGLIGLVCALVRIRAEHRVRAAELRGFLRSGQSVSGPLDTGGSRRRTAGDARVVTIPYAQGRDRAGPPRDSAARSALRRAVARGGQRFQPDRTRPISAG